MCSSFSILITFKEDVRLADVTCLKYGETLLKKTSFFVCQLQEEREYLSWYTFGMEAEISKTETAEESVNAETTRISWKKKQKQVENEEHFSGGNKEHEEKAWGRNNDGTETWDIHETEQMMQVYMWEKKRFPHLFPSLNVSKSGFSPTHHLYLIASLQDVVALGAITLTNMAIQYLHIFRCYEALRLAARAADMATG